MNAYFTKTILYAYPVIDDVIDQIDELVEKKSLYSINDTSPAISQCEKLVDFNIQKSVLFIIKEIVSMILSKFSEDELLHLDYKYFKRKDRSEFDNFDYLSRNYFRRQIKIFNKFNEKLEKTEINDEWFKKNCLTVDFFKNLLKNVIEHELYSYKNKKSIDKKERREISERVKETYKKLVA